MIDLLFEDKEVIVCNKPSGVPSQGDKTGDEDMLSLVCGYLRETGNASGGECAFPVHRLDRTVGGVMVFAKTKAAAASLSKSIQDGAFRKAYLAVVNGCANKTDRLQDFLLKNERLNISKVVSQNTKNAKEAVLIYECIKTLQTGRDGVLSLVKVDLLTGRHHQIRVQLANAGLPIWGDTKYNPKFFRKPGFHFIALWSAELSFRHPGTGEIISFELPPHDQYPFTEFPKPLIGINAKP